MKRYVCLLAFTWGVSAGFVSGKLYEEGKGDLASPQQQEHQLSKESLTTGWKATGHPFSITKVDDLLRLIRPRLEHLEKNPKDATAQWRVFYNYNLLRELLGFSKATSFKGIDKAWIDKIYEERAPFLLMRTHEWTLPTLDQRALIKEAQEIIGLREHIIVASIPSVEPEAYSGSRSTGRTPYLALCSTPDLDIALFIIYHELGHLVRKDGMHDFDLEEGRKTYEYFLNEPMFQSDLKKIEHCLELGKEAFSNKERAEKTAIGKILYTALESKIPFWIPPKSKKAYIKSLYLRGTEQRADLFACQKLFEKKEIGPLLAFIDHEVKDIHAPNYFVIQGETKYPSHIERALYLSGFLIDKGIDIFAELTKWEKKGMCRPLKSKELFPVLPEMGPIEKAYVRWFEQKKVNYGVWKKEMRTLWKSKGITSDKDQRLDLIALIRAALAKLKSNPENEDYQIEALYPYNYLLELLGWPIVHDASAISEDLLNVIRVSVALDLSIPKPGKGNVQEVR